MTLLTFPTTIGSDIFLFLLTIVVGYFAWALAYNEYGLLREWKEIPAFDKTVMTFIVGGVITLTATVAVSLLLGSSRVIIPDFIEQNVF